MPYHRHTQQVRHTRQTPARRGRVLRPLLLALVATLCLAQSGCILVVLGLLSAPIAVGGAITGAAVGTRTAYVNFQDFYDAIEAENVGVDTQVTIRGLRLMQNARNAYQTLTQTLAPHGLTPERYLTLMQLHRRNGQRDSELVRNLGIPDLDLAQTIKDLRERNWVTMKRIEGAATFLFYATTENGEAQLEKGRPALEHMRFEYLRRLSLSDRRQLTRLIAKAVGEADSPAAGTTGGVLGLSTGGEAEFLLSKLIILAQAHAERLYGKFGLGGVEFQIVSALWLKEEIGPKTLTAMTQLRREEMRKVIADLAQRGYLQKVDQVSEEGGFLIRLAPKAVEARTRMQPEVDDLSNRIFARLSESERLDMMALIYKMTRGVVS